MTTSYLGKMCKKEIIASAYDVTDAGCAYYIGHYLTLDGLKNLK